MEWRWGVLHATTLAYTSSVRPHTLVYIVA
jgi:hypothetical protein